MESPIIRLAQKFIGGFLDDGTEKSECTFWPTQYNLTAPLKNKYKTIVKDAETWNQITAIWFLPPNFLAAKTEKQVY